MSDVGPLEMPEYIKLILEEKLKPGPGESYAAAYRRFKDEAKASEGLKEWVKQ